MSEAISPPPRLSAVVLAGGRAARLGGMSKPGLVVGGASLLQIALAAARTARAQRTIIVGPVDLKAAEAILVTEDPPFGGPVAGLAAGLGELERLGDDADWILVLPVDLPRAGTAAALLVAALAERAADPIDGLYLSDADGRAQWLTAVYRRTALLGAVGRGGPSRGRSARQMVSTMALVAVDDHSGASADIDTWDDLAQHRGTAPHQAALHQTAHPEAT